MTAAAERCACNAGESQLLVMGSGDAGRIALRHDDPHNSNRAMGPREAIVIWLLLAWCGVAVWLGLAIGRVLRDSRHEDPVANRSRMQLVRAVPEARSSHTHEGALRADEIHEFHHLLSTLNKLDPKLAKTAMLRWIGGLSKPAIAATLGTTVGAVEHDLQLAKFLLRKTVRTLPTDAG